MKQRMERILHCVKRIAHLLGIVKEEFDDLCDALGVKEGGCDDGGKEEGRIEDNRGSERRDGTVKAEEKRGG